MIDDLLVPNKAAHVCLQVLCSLYKREINEIIGDFTHIILGFLHLGKDWLPLVSEGYSLRKGRIRVLS
jgi:hypothetical protein